MKAIEQLQFKLLSPEEIRRTSVKEIGKTEVYDADGYPVEDGVMDPHLGVIDPGMICATCGGRMNDCQGHFGHIELAKPVVHVLYVKKVRNILRFTCHKCQALLKKDKNDRFLKSNLLTTCPKCGESQGEVKMEKPYFFVEDNDVISTEEIRRRFENIADADLPYLDIHGGRPEWLILTRIPVPPVTIRPSITLDTGERSEDDLTHKLVDVIRINQRLLNNIEIEAPEFIIEDLGELLQYHVSTFFDNDISGIPPARHRSGRALKSVIERLEGKEGRFRQNLIGKRANFSARTVISPDPEIDFDEIGVPQAIASELTVPVKVTQGNIEQMREMVLNGNEYPGINYVFRPDGTKKKVTDENKDHIAEELEPDFIVERNIMDGDVVLFNRQPSLHRMSIMAHRARIVPYRTFRLNLIACAPYNADFDGDEMNLHVPQTEEAKTEAKELLSILNHIKSPKTGAPLVGFIQDHISGLYLLSQATLSKEEAFDLLMSIGEYDASLPEKDEIDGKELISQFIPNGIQLRQSCAVDEDLVIDKGEMKSGVLDEDSVGDEGGELINQIHLYYGKDETARVLNRLSRLGAQYLTRKGFSISIADLEVSQEARHDIKQVIDDGISSANELIEQYRNGEISPMAGKTAEETLESKLFVNLQDISSQAQSIVKNDIGETSARIMAESGARGSTTNLALMAGLLGQEMVGGQRIARGYRNRTTSHFQENDLRPQARGFVSSSILEGMDPIESFYDIMSQREGLMDTSLRTRTSGYMYRRLANSLQDLKVEYDGTVRTADNTIVQFMAGEDGIDPSKSNKGEATV